MPAVTQFARRRRADHPGAALPVRLHHDRLRRHLGLPRAHRLGHDAEDDRQGVGHPADRLRRDADRRARRRRGAHRRDGAPPRRLLRHQRGAGGVRQRSASRSVNLHGARAGGRRNGDGADRRRGLAGGRHGADLQRPAGHEGPDGLLVPLRHHVRGALHPDDHRRRHARGALPRAGVLRPRLQAVRAHRLDAGHDRLDAARRVRVGLFHLDGQHRHHLADVRHQQPAARGGRAR